MSENDKKIEQAKVEIPEESPEQERLFICASGDTKKTILRRWDELNLSNDKKLSHNEFLEALLITNIHPKTLVRTALDKTRKDIYIFSNMDPKLDDLVGYVFALIQQCYLKDLDAQRVHEEFRKAINKVKGLE